MVGSVAPAQAASPKFISVSAAYAALPAAKALPGQVRLEDKVLVPGQSGIVGCFWDSPIPFKATMVGAEYAQAHHQTPSEKAAGWQVTAVVFKNATLAKAAAAKVVTVEKGCSKTLPTELKNSGISYGRSFSKRYSMNGWSGYRTIDTVSGYDLMSGPAPVGLRVTNVIVTRGNVMLNILEQGTIEKGTYARQAAYATNVSHLITGAFNKLG